MKAKMMYAFGLLSVFVLFACSDEENEPPIVAVESISISPSSISLERDKTYQLQAEVTPKEATGEKGIMEFFGHTSGNCIRKWIGDWSKQRYRCHNSHRRWQECNV